MSNSGTIMVRVFVVVVLVTSLGAALFHLFGGLFFLATSTFWTFTPPLSLLGLMALLAVSNRFVRLSLGYGIVTIYGLSYVFEGWQWFLDRYAREGFFVYPDLLESALVLSLMLLLHFDLQRASAASAGSSAAPE